MIECDLIINRKVVHLIPCFIIIAEEEESVSSLTNQQGNTDS